MLSKLSVMSGAAVVDEFVESEMIALLPRLTRFAKALTRSNEEAEDLVQATCERAISNLDKWRHGTRFDSWMYRIAHNLHRNARRDAANRNRKLDLVAAGAAASEDGEANAIAAIRFREAQTVIATLPADQRAALLLVAVEGRSYREVAEITDSSEAAVNSRVARAREVLRRALAEDADG